MPTYTAPGVYYEIVDQSTAGIAPIRTDIAAFLGIAQKGPAHKPTAVQSWDQFQSAFGGFLSNGFLAYSAKAFFENGGSKLYVVRVVAPTVKTSTSATPQPADRASSIVISTSGFVPGAIVTATQLSIAHAAGAQPADRARSIVDTTSGFPAGSIVRISQLLPAPLQTWRRVSLVDEAAKSITWDSPLDSAFILVNPLLFQSRHSQDLLLQTVTPSLQSLGWSGLLESSFNLALSIDFATGASSAAGTLYDSAGNVTLSIEADSPGTWGNSITVAVSQSSLAATMTSFAPQPVTGAASYLQSVTGFPVGSLVHVYQSKSPTATSDYRIVKSIDPTVNLIQWDAPLAPEFDVTRPISFETREFGLAVHYQGEVLEIFSGLSLEPVHPRYVETAVKSQYIGVHNLHSPSPSALRLPDPQSVQLNGRILSLTAGRDGIAALTATTFTGDSASTLKWGLRTLEDVDEVAILAAADILIPPSPATVLARSPAAPQSCCPQDELPATAGPSGPLLVEAAPVFSAEDIFRVQQAIVQHCQMMQFRFAVLDPPSSDSPSLHTDIREVQSWRQRFDSSYAALYFPWVMVRDPLQLNNRVVRRIPPSGHVVGVYASTDLTVGVHKAPANTPLLWAQDLTANVTTEVQEVLNPLAIDCLRAFPGRGLRIYGARTVSSDPAWRYVNVRRLVSMIEHALVLSLQWVVFEPNNVLLWHKVRVAATGFLQMLWQKGALSGNTAQEAFFVRCDETTNPPYTAAAGQMIVEIGVAPVIPAEFVVFRIGRTEDVLEVTEA
jgi:phage tail sheath protein FI